MELNLPSELKKLDMNILTVIFGIYMIVIGVVYYFIFHKHHKKNKVELNELISLVTKFYTLTMLSTIMIFVGIACIINANSFKESRTDIIVRGFAGIVIITITIINYVFYIKRNLKDFEQEEREKVRKATMKIGEFLEAIFFIIFILMPIWRIPVFIEVFENKKVLMIELVRSFRIMHSCASIIKCNKSY